MATPAYKFVEKRSSFGWSNNQLIEAATQNSNRKQVPSLDYDTQRNVSALGRRTLMSIGRKLYSDSGAIRGAIDEVARLSVGTFIPQFCGTDGEWGNQAEAWLKENDKWIDIRGMPYSFGTFKLNMVKATLRDGELSCLLTERYGLPKIQAIPAHRIASQLGVDGPVKYAYTKVLDDGTALDADGNILGNISWEGLMCCDGVIVDAYATPVAYRIISDTYGTNISYRDVSANDLVTGFLPDYPDQLRGISALAVCAFDCLDFKDSRRNEMFAQLVNSTFAMQILNETGEVDSAKSALFDPGTAATSNGFAQSLPGELVTPGTIAYFKAGTGQRIEQIKNERPSVNVMNFQADLMRTAMHGIGWSTDFSIDPTKAGGAQMRIVIEKINARIREIQDYLVAPVVRRIDGWRISKAIQAGYLPPNKEWWKWEYQGPAEVTADAKYDSDIDLQENRAGFTPLKRIAARRGEYWEEVQDQVIAEEKRLQERCKAEGVDPNRVKLLTPNGNATIDPGSNATDSQPSTNQEQP